VLRTSQSGKRNRASDRHLPTGEHILLSLWVHLWCVMQEKGCAREARQEWRRKGVQTRAQALGTRSQWGQVCTAKKRCITGTQCRGRGRVREGKRGREWWQKRCKHRPRCCGGGVLGTGGQWKRVRIAKKRCTWGARHRGRVSAGKGKRSGSSMKGSASMGPGLGAAEEGEWSPGTIAGGLHS
jgi:hypothetical protein